MEAPTAQILLASARRTWINTGLTCALFSPNDSLMQSNKKPGGTKGRKFWPPPGIYAMIVAFLSTTAYLYLALVVPS
jgi:hypothetical protein